MKATLILLPIFVISFFLGYAWSYLIVYKNGFEGKAHHHKKLSIPKFVGRTKVVFKNFIIMCVAIAIPLLLFGDAAMTFEAPSLMQLVLGFLVVLLADDVWFYSLHRIMHEVKWLYKRVHSVHHRVIPPIPMDYLYVHPAEAVSGGFGIVLGMVGVHLIFGEANIWILAAYSAYRPLHELIIHSGQEIVPSKWLGPLGSSKHHFNHHRYNSGNYASGLTVLDKLLRTEIVK